MGAQAVLVVDRALAYRASSAAFLQLYITAMSGQPWEVVGGGDKGGIIVRKGADVNSTPLQRLATGAIIRQIGREGDRLKYEKLSGTGPETGWISTAFMGKDLAVKVSDVWRVAHTRLALREEKSTDAKAISTLKEGDTLRGELDDGWVKTSIQHLGGPLVVCYGLVDGRSKGLGILLEKVASAEETSAAWSLTAESLMFLECLKMFCRSSPVCWHIVCPRRFTACGQ